MVVVTAGANHGQFLAFNKVTGKKQKDPFAMWSHIEGMALFVNDDIMEWHSMSLHHFNSNATT